MKKDIQSKSEVKKGDIGSKKGDTRRSSTNIVLVPLMFILSKHLPARALIAAGCFFQKILITKKFLTSLFGFYMLNITPWTNSGFVICCYLDFVTREQRQPINNEWGFRTAFHIETTKITPRSRHTVINIKPL